MAQVAYFSQVTRRSRRSRARGFTLVETVVALAVLAFALVGALAGFVAAANQMRIGQTRQAAALLADASAQRWILASKTASSPLITSAVALATACPTANCAQLPVSGSGTTPWAVDTSASADPLDIGAGGFFNVLPNGTLVRLAGGGTTCNAPPASSLPVFCRELLITASKTPISSLQGTWATWPPNPSSAINAVMSSLLTYNSANTTPIYTVWIRVSRSGQPQGQAVNLSSSFMVTL